MPLLDGDLAEIMLCCATGTLAQADIGWYDKAAVCVVMAAGGTLEAINKACLSVAWKRLLQGKTLLFSMQELNVLMAK